MKKTFVFFLIVLVTFGCKGNRSTGSTDSTGTQDTLPGSPITVPSVRNYSPSELAVGRRICLALKNKREFFTTLTDQQEKFRFRGELKYCGNPNPSQIGEFNATISNSGTQDLEYISMSTRPNYFKDIVHDQNGAMKTLCENLSVSNSVSNTTEVGGSKITVNFLIQDGFDKFEVSKKTKDVIVSIEGVTVVTQPTQALQKFYGTEKERIRYTPCSGIKDISYTKQTWLGAVTNF